MNDGERAAAAAEGCRISKPSVRHNAPAVLVVRFAVAFTESWPFGQVQPQIDASTVLLDVCRDVPASSLEGTAGVGLCSTASLNPSRYDQAVAARASPFMTAGGSRDLTDQGHE